MSIEQRFPAAPQRSRVVPPALPLLRAIFPMAKDYTGGERVMINGEPTLVPWCAVDFLEALKTAGKMTLLVATTWSVADAGPDPGANPPRNPSWTAPPLRSH